MEALPTNHPSLFEITQLTQFLAPPGHCKRNSPSPGIDVEYSAVNLA